MDVRTADQTQNRARPRQTTLSVDGNRRWVPNAVAGRRGLTCSRGQIAHQDKPTQVVADAAVFQERARIARELHDSVSQTLYAITLTASRARLLLDQNDLQHIEVLEILGDVVELADTGQSELRSLLANIGSNLLTSGGLINALAKLAGDFRVRGDVVGLDIRLSLIDEPDVPAATKEGLVLIAREALQNVVRHSGADRVDIVLETDAESLVLRIADNGHGFQPTSQWPGHFGLQSMRDRASAIEGVLTLVSGEAIGTQVRVCVPRVRGQSWMNSTG